MGQGSIKNLYFSFLGQLFQYCLLGLKACRLRLASHMLARGHPSFLTNPTLRLYPTRPSTQKKTHFWRNIRALNDSPHKQDYISKLHCTIKGLNTKTPIFNMGQPKLMGSINWFFGPIWANPPIENSYTSVLHYLSGWLVRNSWIRVSVDLVIGEFTIFQVFKKLSCFAASKSHLKLHCFIAILRGSVFIPFG